MNTGLRRTDQAREWLKRFDYGERSTAAALLDGLILVSHDEFQSCLAKVLRSIASTARSQVALFSAREQEDHEYFPADEPGRPPDAVGHGAGVGSEGPLANLIRDASRANQAMLDHPSIEELRKNRVKSLLVIDDIIGSGTRVSRFIKWLSRNRSLRSWLSSGHISFQVGAFAATLIGRDRLSAVPGVSSVECAHVAHHGRTKWSEQQLKSIQALCKKYAPRTGWKYWPLGYKNAMTMFVFQHGCPNTAPPILWRRSKKWGPLFDGRPEFAFAPWPARPDDGEQMKQVLESLGLTRLRELHWMQYLAPQARARFIVLAALCKRRFTIDVLSDIAEVSVYECEELVRECEQFKWTDELQRITKRGLQELRQARALNLVGDDTPVLTDAIYVPQSYRGG